MANGLDQPPGPGGAAGGVAEGWAGGLVWTGGGAGTRIELANALFEYLEIFHNRRRRQSALGMLTPIEYELTIGEAEPVA